MRNILIFLAFIVTTSCSADDFKKGVLPNGLTYYIKKDTKSFERADFYFFQNSGANMENNQQNGLAHFIEHMAFNSGKNFPNMGVSDFFENNGLVYGEDFNAITKNEETMYHFRNMTTTQLDSSLLLLKNWCSGVTFDKQEVAKEIPVISREYYSRKKATAVNDAILAKVLAGTRQVERNIIGELSDIQACTTEKLADYYKKWYQPSLQAIIITGDVNVKEVEKKIKKMFDYKNKSVKRTTYLLPYHKQPTEVHLPLRTRPTIELIYKRNEKRELHLDVINDLTEILVNRRLKGLGGTLRSEFSLRNYKHSIIQLDMTRDWVNQLKIVQQAKAGFYDHEISEAKSILQKRYNDISQQKGYEIESIREEFFKGIKFDDVNDKIGQQTRIIKEITQKDIDATLQHVFVDENWVALKLGNANFPALEQIKNEIAKIKVTTFPEYPTRKLITEIISKPNSTVKNNIKVVYNSIACDEVRMTLVKKGGYQMVSDQDLPSADFINRYMNYYQMNGKTYKKVNEFLEDKDIDFNILLKGNLHGFEGHCDVKDIKVLLQMFTAYMTAVEPSENQFKSLKDFALMQQAKQTSNASAALNDTINLVNHDYNPRIMTFSPGVIERYDFNKVNEIYKQFTATNDYTLFVSGNVNGPVKKLIEDYILSIPESNVTQKEYAAAEYTKSDKSHIFYKHMLNSSTTIYSEYHTTGTEYACANMFSYVMKKRLTDELRIRRSLIYSVYVDNRVDEYNQDLTLAYIYDLPEAQENSKELAKAVVKQPLTKKEFEYGKSCHINKVIQINRLKLYHENIIKETMLNAPVINIQDVTYQDLLKFTKKFNKATNVEVLMRTHKK